MAKCQLIEPAMERNKPRKAKPASNLRVYGVVVKSVVAVVLAGGLVVALAWFGRHAGHAVAPDPRYTVRIADLDCATPPNTDRTTFLTEVRYIAGLPETIQSVDPTMPGRLKQAFVQHPWVREVTSVAVEADGKIKVVLHFRVPILALHIPGETEPRALDAVGVLLPLGAPTKGLATLLTPTTGTGIAGQPWPDANARRAAELIFAHPAKQIEKKGKDWLITQGGGRVLRVSAP